MIGRVYFVEEFVRKRLLSRYTDLCIADRLRGERIILDDNAVAKAMAFVERVIDQAL